MNAIFFAVYLFILILIIEVATILLEATGLRKEVARFQAISLLTGTGFTTSESELVINHPVRRKIASFLIVFGAVSLAIILSYVISFFVTSTIYLSDLGIGVGVLIGAIFILRSPFIHTFLSRNIGSRFDKYYVHHKSVEEVFHLDDENVMRQFVLTESHRKLINIPLKQLRLADLDIKILHIMRNNVPIKNPTGSTVLLPGDEVLVYGNVQRMREYFYLSEKARK